MWRSQSQLIKTYLERMVRRGTLPKIVFVAGEVGMGEDEFYSKVSINPRTPMQTEERIAIEHVMASRDPETFQQYLREFHMTDSITVEEADQWVR